MYDITSILVNGEKLLSVTAIFLFPSWRHDSTAMYSPLCRKKATQTEYSREDCISFLLKGIFPHMYSAFATGAICKTHNGNSPITINAKMVIKKKTMVGRGQGCVLLCKRHKKPNFMTHFLTTIRQKKGFSVKK